MRRVFALAILAALALSGLTVAPQPIASVASGTDEGFVVDLSSGSAALLPPGSRHIVGDWYEVPASPGSQDALAGSLRDLPGVRQVVANHHAPLPLSPVRVAATALARTFGAGPSDPSYGLQWHFPAVGAPAAWPLTTGFGTTVAVIDSGVSKGPDLACHTFVDEYDALIGTSGVGAADDWFGHGTHVAGTIAQCTNNGIGVAGLAYDTRLMPIKALGPSGGPAAAVADGIVWATDHGADVINLSLGWPCSGTWDEQPDCIQPVVSAAIEYAAAHDVVMVAASGNEGFCLPTFGWVAFPANHPEVIGVGATDALDGRPGYSDCGPDLSLVAPGGDMRADANGDGNPDGILQESFDTTGFGLFWMDGTSSAAPHVAGAAAMLRAAAPHVPAVGIRAALEATAADLGEPGFDAVFGAGRLDIASALQSPHLAVDRLFGSNRYETAAAVSRATFPIATTVYLTTGAGFADALAVSAAAGATGAPVLLLRTDFVPAATATELTRLAPEQIVIAGGPAAVSDTVEAALSAYGSVRRLGGADRYDTARLIAMDTYPTGADTVVVVTGADYPDGLAAAPLAAPLGAPVLLTRPDSLPDATAGALRALAPTSVVVVGGPGAVSVPVADQIASLVGVPVVRIAGPDRYATAAAVANLAFPGGAPVTWIATGAAYPDALTGAAAVAALGGPLLLARVATVPPSTSTAMGVVGPSRITIVGGPGAISDEVLLSLAGFITP